MMQDILQKAVLHSDPLNTAQFFHTKKQFSLVITKANCLHTKQIVCIHYDLKEVFSHRASQNLPFSSETQIYGGILSLNLV